MARRWSMVAVSAVVSMTLLWPQAPLIPSRLTALVAAGTNASCVGCDGILFSNATIDVCGICAGTNESCSDACGVPHGNNASCTDLCGMLLGDGQSCLDACGVAFGTNESCSGCDGVPNSGRTVDACGSW